MAVLRRPTISVLHRFVQQVQNAAQALNHAALSGSKQPSLHQLLTSSSSFLSSYLPPRLHSYHHSHHYHRYSNIITDLASFAKLRRCCHRAARQEEWIKEGKATGTNQQDIQQFNKWSQQIIEDIEEAVTHLTNELRQIIINHHQSSSISSSTSFQLLQSEVSGLLDTTYSLLIELRLHLSHHFFAYDVWSRAQSHSSSLNVEEIALDYPLATKCDVRSIINSAIHSSRAAATEKYGDAPDIIIKEMKHYQQQDSQQPSSISMIGVEAHLFFILMEILKNSLKAMIEQVGAVNVFDAEPIVITLSQSNDSSSNIKLSRPTLGIIVADKGIGLGEISSVSSSSSLSSISPTPSSLFHYFLTSTTAKRLRSSSSSDVGSDWRYSRSFGSAFSGLGVGLPLCRLYCSEIYGGGLNLAWIPGLTQTFITLNPLGTVPIGRLNHQ